MDKKVISVTQVNGYIKNLFDNDYLLNNLWIQGEVSNLKIHSSGHIYFTMKDSLSSINCVMFRNYSSHLAFDIKDGVNLLANGAISVYEKTGQYQLYVRDVIQDGIGQLYQKFEALKVKLEKEGLFDVKHKKEIPKYPKKIGIVTAKTGAAIQDIINISKRRNPYIQLVLFSSLVQGANAHKSIIQGIKYFEEKERVDIIIIGRGGGSIEDLWEFNNEELAHTIFDASTPIISAVGHETDFTISDFVADLRAPTPSAAAEISIPMYEEIIKNLNQYQEKFIKLLVSFVDDYKYRVAIYKTKIESKNPRLKIEQSYEYIVELQSKLEKEILNILKEKKQELELITVKINGLSPYKKLENGFGYIRDSQNKRVISIECVKKNDIISIMLHNGIIKANVEDVKKGND